jgi:hypothetical protein
MVNDDGIVKEDGKTFYKMSLTYIRQQDDNYFGKKTEYSRCLKCNKLVSTQWMIRHKKYCK